jgi:hypothetical protein
MGIYVGPENIFYAETSKKVCTFSKFHNIILGDVS